METVCSSKTLVLVNNFHQVPVILNDDLYCKYRLHLTKWATALATARTTTALQKHSSVAWPYGLRNCHVVVATMYKVEFYASTPSFLAARYWSTFTRLPASCWFSLRHPRPPTPKARYVVAKILLCVSTTWKSPTCYSTIFTALGTWDLGRIHKDNKGCRQRRTNGTGITRNLVVDEWSTASEKTMYHCYRIISCDCNHVITLPVFC